MTPPAELDLTLPWPPSVNRYWSVMSKGPLAGRLLISKEALRYRTRVQRELALQGSPFHRWAGSIAVEILAWPPDRRARDLDNILKPILDALKFSRVLEDDRFVDRLTITRASVVADGRLDVVLRLLKAQAVQPVQGELIA